MESTEANSRATVQAWMGLGVLMAFYLLSYLDKQILALLANLIGPALSLSDTRIGLLQGFIFSIPYSAGVLLMGMAVDRYSRRRLLFGGVLFWSICALASGLATSFESLGLARAGVGLGEAVLIPAAMSIIATLFPRERVATAIGLFYSAANVGGIVAMLLGGTLIQLLVQRGGLSFPAVGALEPWQAAFALSGLPGLLMAFLAFGIPIDDRGRKAGPTDRAAAGDRGPLMAYLRAHKVFLITFFVGSSCGTICAYTLISWAPAYFGRSFQWSHSIIGALIALSMVFGALGNIGWGALADAMSRRGHPDALYRLYIPLLLISPFIAIAAFVLKTPAVSLPAFCLSALVYNGFGPLLAALQLAAPDQLRGRLTGMKMVFTSVVGLGLGPVVAGFLTDAVFHDRAMLGHAMTISIFGASWIGAASMILGRGAYLRALQVQTRREIPRPVMGPVAQASTS